MDLRSWKTKKQPCVALYMVRIHTVPQWRQDWKEDAEECTMLKLTRKCCLWFNSITIISTNYFDFSRPVSNGPDEPGVFGLPSYPLDGLALWSYRRRRQQFNNQRQIQQFRIRQRIQRHLWRQCLQLRLPSNSSQRLRNSRWRLQLPQYTGEEEYQASAPRKQEKSK